METMNLSVKTASGKEFLVDHSVSGVFGYVPTLYIEFIGYTMKQIFDVFSDTDEIQTIYGYVMGQLNKTYEGYTKFAEIFMVPDTEDHIRIRLEQGVQLNILGA